METSIKQISKWILRLLAPYKWRLVAFICLGCLRVGCGLAFVWVSRSLIDVAVAKDSDPSLIWRLSALLASLLLAEMVFRLAAQYVSAESEIKLKNRLRDRLFNCILESRWIERQRVHSGDWLSRLTEDVRVIASTAVQSVPQTLVLGAQFAGAFAFLCFLSWKLAVIVVGITPFFILLSKVYVRRTRRLTGKIRSDESGMQIIMQEGITHQMVVQTLEAVPSVAKEFDNAQASIFNTTMQRQRFSIFSSACMSVGFLACFLTAFLWSVWHLHTGAITFGTMTAFLQLVARLQNPVVGIAHLFPSMVQSISSAERLMEIEGLHGEKAGKPVRIKGPVGIRFSNLDFSYPGISDKVLKGFSHDFKPGSKTVLMGPTGVGKSTVTKLILGLLSPDSGSIELYSADGNNSVKAGPSTRVNLSYVPQGNSLLKGTVRDNLLLARPDASEKDMLEALRIADAEFVLSLPNGIDTECGEKATSLSEGQAQRIAIARALLRESSVLILDEFNSSLDADTADRIMHRLMESRKDVTMIFISHRPEILKFCQLLQLESAPLV